MQPIREVDLNRHAPRLTGLRFLPGQARSSTKILVLVFALLGAVCSHGETYTIYGDAPDNTDTIIFRDTLSIVVDGTSVYSWSHYGNPMIHPPVSFSADVGSKIHIEAKNLGPLRGITALWLRGGGHDVKISEEVWGAPPLWWVPAPPGVFLTVDYVITNTPLKGCLRTIMVPTAVNDLGAQWTIDGGSSWHTNAETICDLSVGSYAVTFSPVSGYDSPPPYQAVVQSNQVTVASGVYTQQVGTLLVTTVPAWGEWSIDGGTTWNTNGQMLLWIQAGPYTLSFKDVPDYTTPVARSITVPKDSTLVTNVVYVRQTGRLTASIQPPNVQPLAKWRLTSGPDTSWKFCNQAIVGLPTGPYTAVFDIVPGWTTPPTQQVGIVQGENVVAGTYEQQTGALTFTLDPPEVWSSDPGWKVDGDSVWRDSGYTYAGLAVGIHNVFFKTIQGWDVPGNVSATVLQNQTNSVTAIYVPRRVLRCNTTTLYPVVTAGNDAASATFEVWNLGSDLMSYTISDDAGWLVTPTSGTSSGEHDTIAVHFSTAGLAPGTTNATITVSADLADGSPVKINVVLTVLPNTPHFGDYVEPIDFSVVPTAYDPTDDTVDFTVQYRVHYHAERPPGARTLRVTANAGQKYGIAKWKPNTEVLSTYPHEFAADESDIILPVTGYFTFTFADWNDQDNDECKWQGYHWTADIQMTDMTDVGNIVWPWTEHWRWWLHWSLAESLPQDVAEESLSSIANESGTTVATLTAIGPASNGKVSDPPRMGGLSTPDATLVALPSGSMVCPGTSTPLCVFQVTSSIPRFAPPLLLRVFADAVYATSPSNTYFFRNTTNVWELIPTDYHSSTNVGGTSYWVCAVSCTGVYVLCESSGADIDWDEIPDEWEYMTFQGLSIATPASDFDGDGLLDRYEYASCTDPANSNSFIGFGPSALGLANPDGTELRWYSVAGKSYTVERSLELTNGFSPLASNVVATPPMNVYTDVTASANSTRFYRILVPGD